MPVAHQFSHPTIYAGTSAAAVFPQLQIGELVFVRQKNWKIERKAIRIIFRLAPLRATACYSVREICQKLQLGHATAKKHFEL